jgi:hypothetical protein
MALDSGYVRGVQHSAVRLEEARREHARFRYRQVCLRTGSPRPRQEFYSRDRAGRTVHGSQRLDEGFKLSHYQPAQLEIMARLPALILLCLRAREGALQGGDKGYFGF